MSHAVITRAGHAPDERAHCISRPRLDEVLDDGRWLVAVLVAPPGYGKSVLAQAWVERTRARVASVSIDRLGDDEAVARVLDAAHSLFPGVRAPRRLGARGLVDAVRRAGACGDGPPPGLLVDCAQPIAGTPVWDVVTELVDGLRPALRVLLTCQADPLLPIARWRTEGIVRVLRERDLRFDAGEALAAAAAAGRELAEGTVIDLNERVDGWPLALTLALMAIGDGSSADRDRPAMYVDSLVAAVVGQLAPRARDAALTLSVLEWFDNPLASALVGDDAGPVLATLSRHHLLEVAEPGRGLRFHRVVRELLEAELRWRDPARHAELHRRAAKLWLRRGDWGLAYRHLGSLADRTAVHHLVVEPALALVDRGDRPGLGRLLAGLPRTSSIDDPAVALDLATVSFFAGGRQLAMRWVERAETVGLGDDGLVARAHATRAVLALMDGRLLDASAESDKFLAVRSRPARGGPLEERFGVVRARLALLRGDVVEAQHWIDAVAAQANPPVVGGVTLPGLQAWHDSLVGLTNRARDGATEALDRAAALGCGRHQEAFDAAVVAAWSNLRGGSLALASQHATRAHADASHLGYDWNTVRAAEVLALVHLADRRPEQALAVLAEARVRLSVPDSELATTLVVPEAAACWQLGRAQCAIALLDEAPDRPDVWLLRAMIALDAGDLAGVADSLDGHERWLLPDRIGAELLTAVAAGDDTRLAAVVEEASATGLMLPFLGQGRRVETALLGLSLEGVHPVLIEHLRRRDPGPVFHWREASLTARERSILDLLPSHHTYAEIAELLEVSVNTVKGNLKSIYRKLGVAGRAEAVEAARGSGTI